MVDYAFVPGQPRIGDDVGGSPFNPAGPEFATWLNDILEGGAATHWTTLTANTTATLDDHGSAFRLAGYTLNIDPAVALQAGWRGLVKGPGSIDPNDGTTRVLVDGEWALVGSDGTSTEILRSGAGGEVSLEPRGTWDTLVEYDQSHVVTRSNKTYLSMQDGNVGNDPALDDPEAPVWWMVLAEPIVPAVDSVNGESGTVVLDAADIAFDETGTTYTAGTLQDFVAQTSTKIDQLLEVGDAFRFIGVIDASANPNYPAADAGDTYKISVAGKIGGASGPNVEVGDTIYATADGTAAGDHATVGANWTIVQANVDGAVVGPASAVSDRIAVFDGVSGRLIKDGGSTIQDILDSVILDGTEVVFADDAAITAAHTRKTIVFTKATAVAGTLDPAATLGEGWTAIVTNTGVGDLTLSISGGALFDSGDATIVLETDQSLLVQSNGTVIRAMLRGGGGSGASAVVPLIDDTHVGDGVTTTFTLSFTPASEDALLVFNGGVVQKKDKFSLAGNDVAFATAPADGAGLLFFGLKGSAAEVGAAPLSAEYTGPGPHTLPGAPLGDASLLVWVGGSLQSQTNGVDYTYTGDSLTVPGIAADALVHVWMVQTLQIGQPSPDTVGNTELANMATQTIKGRATAGTGDPEDLTPTQVRTILGSRETLTADRTYYVRTDGSDSNDGLTNTAGGAFLTVQKAIDVAAQLDLSIYDITVQLADGTYTGEIVAKQTIGAGSVTIIGNTTTPSNVVISCTDVSAAFYNANNTTNYILQALKIQTTTAGYGVLCSNAITTLRAVNFGSTVSAHVAASSHGKVIFEAGDYTISGGASSHLFAINGGLIAAQVLITVTLTGTPAFGTYAQATNLGIMSIANFSYSGAATGNRYSASMNSIILTAGDTLPGSTAGSTATGGQYT